MPAGDEHLATLDYAPRPSLRRRWVRRGVLLVLIVGLTFAAYRYGPVVWRQARILYYQHQCMTYTASPMQVVYEEDPAEAAKLLKLPEYSVYPLKRRNNPNNSNEQGPPVNAAAFTPVCWDHFASVGWPGSSTAIMRTPFSLTGVNGAVIFLHEMRTPAGSPRLVCVTYSALTRDFAPYFLAGFNYTPLSIIPATWRQPPTPLPKGWEIDAMSWYPNRPPLVRVYAGQIDPKDPSHFTVAYEMWGQKDIADGRLDNNDGVTLTLRHQLMEPREGR